MKIFMVALQISMLALQCYEFNQYTTYEDSHGSTSDLHGSTAVL